jgi:Glyoxalase-like domain
VGNLKDICFDCADPWMLSHWWADVLGYQVRPYTDEDMAQLRQQGIERPEDDPNVAVDPVGETGPSFWFCRVPEQKVVKNRVHVDIYGDVDELLGRGARMINALPGWTVLADPEGNEFCVFTPVMAGSVSTEP